MPPGRIRSRRQEAHHRRPFPGRLVGFRHPLANLPAVRRVHPADAPPRLLKAIDGRRIIPLALRVLWEGTHIQSEAEFSIEFVEEGLGGFPQARPRTEMDRNLLNCRAGSVFARRLELLPGLASGPCRRPPSSHRPIANLCLGSYGRQPVVTVAVPEPRGCLLNLPGASQAWERGLHRPRREQPPAEGLISNRISGSMAA